MKVTYTGKQKDLLPAQRAKLDAKIAKIAKLMDNRGGEKEVHVILNVERHLFQVEITASYYDHSVAGAGSGADQFTAISEAFDKLEKQIQKLRTKWRDTKRGPKEAWADAQEEAPERVAEAEVHDADGAAEKRIFRVNHHKSRKPMTLEEAVLEMEKDRDYVVYLDSENDHLSVLLRRRDGNFDLIQA